MTRKMGGEMNMRYRFDRMEFVGAVVVSWYFVRFFRNLLRGHRADRTNEGYWGLCNCNCNDRNPDFRFNGIDGFVSL